MAMPCMDSAFSASSDASFGALSLSLSFSSIEEHAKFRKVEGDGAGAVSFGVNWLLIQI